MKSAEPTTGRLRRIGAAARSGIDELRSRFAEMQHARTPIGRAEAAHDRGDSRFLIELPVDEMTMRTVEKIEAVGWQFVSVDYVRSETTTTTNELDGSSEVHRTGTTNGVYLFGRATELRRA